jgi:LysM repeat protein
MKYSAWKIVVVLILVSYITALGLSGSRRGDELSRSARQGPAPATRTPRPTFTAVPPESLVAGAFPTHTPPPDWTQAPSATAEATIEPSLDDRCSAAESAAVLVTATDTPQPTPTSTATATATPMTHAVRAGENLTVIAARYGTTVDAIVTANGLLNPDRIPIDQVLIIPPPVQATPTPTASQ